MQEEIVLKEGKEKKGKFDETDLKNLIYKETIQIVEPLEHEGMYKGNAHHLTQKIVDKVASAIIEKIRL